MSELQTYRRDGEDLFVLPDGDDPTEPGQFVGHTAWPTSTVGTVVAIDETEVSVLWSKGPPNHWPEPLFSGSITGFNQNGYVFAPYVPIQVTPAIFSTGSISPIRYGSKPVNQGFYGMVCLTSGSI